MADPITLQEVKDILRNVGEVAAGSDAKGEYAGSTLTVNHMANQKSEENQRRAAAVHIAIAESIGLKNVQLESLSKTSNTYGFVDEAQKNIPDPSKDQMKDSLGVVLKKFQKETARLLTTDQTKQEAFTARVNEIYTTLQGEAKKTGRITPISFDGDVAEITIPGGAKIGGKREVL